MSLKSVQAFAAQRVEDDMPLHTLYGKYEDMVHGRWALPAGLSNVAGIHKTVISDPYDAMNSMRRILSRHIPKFTVHPMAPTEGSKQEANLQEKGIAWMYKQASERRDPDLTEDIAWVAGLYGQVIGQVSYLPHEIEAREAFKGDVSGLREAMRQGPFQVELHNPKYAHVVRTSNGLEGVLTKKLVRATEALSFWGDYAGSLKRKLSKLSEDELYKSYLTLYDYWNGGKERTVWGILDNRPNIMHAPNDDNAIAIMDEEDYGLEFLPW